jgi:N-acetyl sugar amidotransferase
MEKTCSRCILGDTFPNIYFDKDGVCNHCHRYDQRCSKYSVNPENQKKLRSLVEMVKSRGRGLEYDCIQGVSGGRDSTYTLYLLKQWGLNPLAVHVDNRMDSSIAVENIKNACRKLDVDLHNHTVEWEEFKDLQRAFLFASVPSVDIPSDHAFVTVLYDIAEEKNIEYVFSGASFRTEGQGSVEWSLHDDERFILDIQSRHGTMNLNNYPLRTIADVFRWYRKGIREIRPLYWMDYRHSDVDPLLERELGWKYYGGHHFESVFTRWAFAFLLPRKFGIDKRITDYATLVLSKQMTREEAFSKMRESIYSAEQEAEDRKFIADTLDLTEEEMDSVLHAAPKRNFDYDHHSRFHRTLQYLISPWRY